MCSVIAALPLSAKLVEWVCWLRQEVEERGGVVQWGGPTRPTVEANLRMLLVVVEISSDGSVRCAGPPPSLCLPPTPSPAPTMADLVQLNLQQHTFDVIMETGFLRLLLAHYRNQLLFLFVPEAMLVLCCHGDQASSTGERGVAVAG